MFPPSAFPLPLSLYSGFPSSSRWFIGIIPNRSPAFQSKSSTLTSSRFPPLLHSLFLLHHLSLHHDSLIARFCLASLSLSLPVNCFLFPFIISTALIDRHSRSWLSIYRHNASAYSLLCLSPSLTGNTSVPSVSLYISWLEIRTRFRLSFLISLVCMFTVGLCSSSSSSFLNFHDLSFKPCPCYLPFFTSFLPTFSKLLRFPPCDAQPLLCVCVSLSLPRYCSPFPSVGPLLFFFFTLLEFPFFSFLPLSRRRRQWKRERERKRRVLPFSSLKGWILAETDSRNVGTRESWEVPPWEILNEKAKKKRNFTTREILSERGRGREREWHKFLKNGWINVGGEEKEEGKKWNGCVKRKESKGWKYQTQGIGRIQCYA